MYNKATSQNVSFTSTIGDHVSTNLGYHINLLLLARVIIFLTIFFAIHFISKLASLPMPLVVPFKLFPYSSL
jgi:hypothetical protein